MTTKVCLAAVDEMLSKKGSFSYRQDNVHYLALDDNLTIRIARINDVVARLFLVDAQQVQQPIPANVVLANAAGVAQVPFLNNFFIGWVESYTLSFNGQLHMVLDNQKYQAISGPAATASGVI